jgi:hypothetical protein
MNRGTFDNLVNHRINLITETLKSKGAEYAGDVDVFANFVKAAPAARVRTKEKALWGMAMKHFVSIGDMVEGLETEPIKGFSKAYVEEKIGDMINYLILLEAMLKEE